MIVFLCRIYFRQTVNCALCKTETRLLNSHIIPEFFYASIYDNLHRFHIVSSNSLKSEKFGQKGIREKLLCEACEQKFSRWEKYAKETFGDGLGIKIIRSGKIYHLSDLNYKVFRLFLLSLLWRMGVSQLAFFSLINLGVKHQEILRVALLNEDPLEPLQYPCLMTAVHIKGKFHTDWISQPTHNKSGSHHCHSVVINGILFTFYVTSHALPKGFEQVCINKKNEMGMFVSEIEGIPFLMEHAKEMGQAIHSRAKQV